MQEHSPCQAVAKTTGVQCRRLAPPGKTKCVLHSRDEPDESEIRDAFDVADIVRRGAPELAPEERIEWLEQVWRGEVKETKLSPLGHQVRTLVGQRERQAALKLATELQRQLEERRRDYVTRHQLEHACTCIALVLRDRLRAIPARLHGGDVLAVQRLEREIDAALDEGAGELERTLAQMLGDE